MTRLKKQLLSAMVCLVLSCPVFFSAAPGSEDGADPALQEKADQIFRAVDETVMHLNSGVCLVTLVKDSREHTFRLTFDYAAGLYLCETDFLSRLLITPDHYYLFSYSEGTLRASVNEFPGNEYDSARVPFDVLDARSVLGWNPHGGNHLFDYQLRSPFHRGFLDWRVTACEEQPGGQIRVTMAKEYSRNYFATQEFDVDPDRGNTISRIAVEHKSKGRTVFRQNQDFRWRQINETWVPVARRYQQQILEDGDCRDFESEWQIEWFQVNTPLSPALFDPETIRTALEKGAPAYIEEHRVPASPDKDPSSSDQGPPFPVKSKKHAPPSEGELLAGLLGRIVLISLGVFLILFSVWLRWSKKRRRGETG
ncbi:MAG: hypothetical protein IJG60_04245 [Thermoguttaceae bacterium]|nr:hypothetical protein [Thermoguttaceae bacterium]